MVVGSAMPSPSRLGEKPSAIQTKIIPMSEISKMIKKGSKISVNDDKSIEDVQS
jgi:hypothetical protein